MKLKDRVGIILVMFIATQSSDASPRSSDLAHLKELRKYREVEAKRKVLGPTHHAVKEGYGFVTSMLRKLGQCTVFRPEGWGAVSIYSSRRDLLYKSVTTLF